jgi:hypothetical protein
MSPTPLYPLRFEPIYRYRRWGGGIVVFEVQENLEIEKPG